MTVSRRLLLSANADGESKEKRFRTAVGRTAGDKDRVGDGSDELVTFLGEIGGSTALPLLKGREYQKTAARCRVSPETCLSSIILSPLNSNVKMSPYETGDIHVESEGTATRGCNFPLCEGGPGVCQSRRTARSIAATGATPQSALSARR